MRAAMETCVLIPKELSLQAVPIAGVQRSNKRHHVEPEITVMTNVNVPRGTLIYPFQGTVRMDKLDVFSFLDDTDVSTYIYIHIVVVFYVLCCGFSCGRHRLEFEAKHRV